MQNKRVVNLKTERTVDFTTGEVRAETTSNVVTLRTEPPYIKMYIDDLCDLINVPAAQRDLLGLLLQKLDYDGYITLSPRYRQNICEKLKIKDQTFRNRLNLLCKSQILRRVSTNEYEANPRYFARGEWRQIAERRESFEMKIRYSAKGREIVTERVSEEEQADLFQ